MEQVTALLAGKRVLGTPREIQEVRNAFVAYERMAEWSPHSLDDLLTAHGVLMAGLVDAPGSFRSGGVGIQYGEEIVHLAPPASRVPALVDELLAAQGRQIFRSSPVASFITGEFIHPFQDVAAWGDSGRPLFSAAGILFCNCPCRDPY